MTEAVWRCGRGARATKGTEIMAVVGGGAGVLPARAGGARDYLRLQRVTPGLDIGEPSGEDAGAGCA